MTHSVQYGVDIGGTHLRVGKLRHGEILTLHRESVAAHRDPEALAGRLAEIIQPMTAAQDHMDHIGIGLPGIIDFEAQSVLRSPHFPEWVGVPFGEILRDHLRRSVVIDNDANMALQGERHYGKAKALRHAVMITLGTGIGGALLINGALFRGNSGFAGEIGHMVLDLHGPPCACGGRGCWELLSSAQAFSSAPHTVTDSKTWQRFGHHLGAGIASLVNVTGIEDVIIGGGLANAWERFASAMHQSIPHYTYPETAARIRIHRAALGENAAIVGAACKT
jgi:glucokinase